MTHSMTTPIATVAALAAITLFMVASLATAPASQSHLASIPATVEANG